MVIPLHPTLCFSYITDKTFTRFDYVSYPLGASGFTPSILVGSVLIILLVFCAVNFVLLFFILCLLSSVVCVSGLTILDYHFGFLQRLFNK